MTAIHSPKTINDLVKLVAKHGKHAFFVSGVDPTTERIPNARVVIDIGNVGAINDIEVAKDRVVIGTGLNLGRLAREVAGENGLMRLASSLIANPLVRNRITFLQSLDPDSPYFDITTPLVLLDARIRLQNPTAKRTVAIREYLEGFAKGPKKGEIPTYVEFPKMPTNERVGFFRIARASGKGTVSAAARMKMIRGVCKDPEIVVSGLSLIPLRTKAAEKEINGKAASEDSIKRASAAAAAEILAIGDSKNAYERSIIEIAVARTLRTIMEGSIPV